MTDKELNRIRMLKNEYQRQWRKKNPGKVKAIQERYWLKRAQQQMKVGEENATSQV